MVGHYTLPLPVSGKLGGILPLRPGDGNHRRVFCWSKGLVCGLRATDVAVPPAPTFSLSMQWGTSAEMRFRRRNSEAVGMLTAEGLGKFESTCRVLAVAFEYGGQAAGIMQHPLDANGVVEVSTPRQWRGVTA